MDIIKEIKSKWKFVSFLKYHSKCSTLNIVFLHVYKHSVDF